jgi:nucleoside-diphosphate-sugar epimerase
MNNYLSEYKGKNILITGGAGYIGSNSTETPMQPRRGIISTLDKQR